MSRTLLRQSLTRPKVFRGTAVASLSLAAVTFTGVLAVAIASPSMAADSVSPLAGSNGFLVLVEGDASLGPNETDGAIAVGGDLTLAGNHNVFAHGVGGFTASGDARPTALLVGGRVDFPHSDSGAELKVLSNGYVKVGDLHGAEVITKDRNGASVNTVIAKNPASYDRTPRITLTTKQSAASVAAPTGINLGSLFAQFRGRSQVMASLPQTVTPTRSGNQLKITLGTGVNVLNLTAADLAGISEFTFQNKPTAARTLIINVDTTRSSHKLTWRVPNFAGIGGSDASHVLINFPDATSVSLSTNSATVEGSLYAPFANLVNDSQSNLEGNVVAKTFRHGADCGAGEIHAYPFDGEVPITPATSKPPTTSASPSTPATTSAAPTTPATTAPETTAPETTAPETTTPVTTAPETTTPVTTAPETTTPVTTAPETTTPETTAPETTTPVTTAPETTTPVTTAPETTTPVTTAPVTTATESTAPQTTAPETTAPQTTTAAPATTDTVAPTTTDATAPTTSDAPTTAPAVVVTTPASSLPTTGASLMGWLALGIGFLVVGFAMLLATRRTRA